MPTSVHSKLDEPFVRFAYWWAHHEFPLKGSLLTRVGLHEPVWGECPQRVESRAVWHGYRMCLNPRDYYERHAHFYGRYNQFELLLFLMRALEPGDLFIDGGANLGLVTMFGSWRVGPGGHVHAFEPNPRVHERLLWHLDQNNIDNVTPHAVGLSDQPSTCLLRVPGYNTGAGTLGRIPDRYDRVSQEHEIRLEPGDDVLADVPDRPAVLKLDVEGHEHHALRGLHKFLDHRRPAVVVEINPEMLRANDATARVLIDELAGLGYRRFRTLAKWSVLRRRRLQMIAIEHLVPFGRTRDEIWVHPESEHWGRLERYMTDHGFRKRGGPVGALATLRDRI